MATITEIPLKSGTTSYKAVIKQHGKILITKRWSSRKAATAWAKRIESDNEMLEALDSGMATLSFNKLADEYQRWWDGQNRKDKGVPARVKWWKDQLGPMKLIEIRARHVRVRDKTYNTHTTLRVADLIWSAHPPPLDVDLEYLPQKPYPSHCARRVTSVFRSSVERTLSRMTISAC
jgi:hypothetical protein